MADPKAPCPRSGSACTRLTLAAAVPLLKESVLQAGGRAVDEVRVRVEWEERRLLIDA